MISQTFARQARALERKRAIRRVVKSIPDRTMAMLIATVFVLSTAAIIALAYGLILLALSATIPMYNLMHP